MAAIKKLNFTQTLNAIAEIVEGQLSKLPPGVADAKRKKIDRIAARAGSQGRGKAARPSRTRVNRLSVRPRAKSS